MFLGVSYKIGFVLMLVEDFYSEDNKDQAQIIPSLR